ncbi:Rieske (2Fe-2S) protein [Dyadobacter chenwenxiniae]|uniref:Rieske (2Fe-2S) protein n=1 Tax=Dyadobacter chenwenxiniae TaxID=2906456 RepID=A0A9X1PKJ1_9BACT|nr:Rieske (2Fe-2S) protein [Dyadobacter chenwenxiniae]MCF0061894.1 Rieske (2Fe-2S) protein [Dyadobacter chenwenxiniae]UON81709.1 Rieske (2Fe-2S) protein [Dyadobacter chenwenxiniae]
MENVKADKMKRGEFLRSLGLSTSTLMAFYCLGTTMTACGSSDNEPEPEPNPGTGGSGVSGTTTGTAINFTLDLTKDDTKKLKTAGESQVFGDVLVALTTTNQYVALSKICTHQQSTVGYRKAQNDIQCPTHQSEFSLTGAVEQGPATSPLKAYKTTLSTDGNTLTVAA